MLFHYFHLVLSNLKNSVLEVEIKMELKHKIFDYDV